MEYRHLGRTGLRVSPLCLGTMNFGPETDEATGHQIMDAALEAGINFFDTANVYGGRETEQIIGRWFAQGGGRREKVVLATKVYGGRDPWPNTSRLSALHLRQACEDSLRRLQTDHIDLYQMHHVDRDTPWDEIWQAMDLLVAQGKVIYVGSSNFAGWHLVQASEAARRRGSLGLVSEQSLYNLRARTVELEVLPAAEAYGIGVIPWSPLGGGLLGGALRKVTEGRRGAERVQQQVERRSGPARGLGGPVRRAGRGAGRRGAGLAAAPAGGHGADHRTPHTGAVPGLVARPRDHPRPGGLGSPRLDLPGPGRFGSGGVRLVGRAGRVRRTGP